MADGCIADHSAANGFVVSCAVSLQRSRGFWGGRVNKVAWLAPSQGASRFLRFYLVAHGIPQRLKHHKSARIVFNLSHLAYRFRKNF